MQSIGTLTREQAKSLLGLCFDLDDTFLTKGQLPEAAYSSLFRLRESGLRLFVLTGRPFTWAELAARMWPIDGAIAENGALAVRLHSNRLETFDPIASAERHRRKTRLAELARDLSREVPRLVQADDSAGRTSDMTFDIGEHERAREEDIQAAVSIGRRAGAHFTRSSVHLHFSFDRADKASGAVRYLASLGQDPTAALSRFAFIGDSQNDTSCFAAFRYAIGVANLSGFHPLPPAFRAQARASEGFVEVAETLCALRR